MAKFAFLFGLVVTGLAVISMLSWWFKRPTKFRFTEQQRWEKGWIIRFAVGMAGVVIMALAFSISSQ